VQTSGPETLPWIWVSTGPSASSDMLPHARNHTIPGHRCHAGRKNAPRVAAHETRRMARAPARRRAAI
jgi:hypothetical protein